MTDRDRWSDQNRWREDEGDDYRGRRGASSAQAGQGSSRYASDTGDSYGSRQQGQQDYSGEYDRGGRGNGYGSSRGSGSYGPRSQSGSDSRGYDTGSEFQTSRQRYGGSGSYGGSSYGSAGGDYFGAGDYGSGAHAWDRGSEQSYAGSGRYSSSNNPSGLTSAPGSYDRNQSRQSFQRNYDRGQERGFLDRASDEVMSWFGDEDAARRREADHSGHGPSDYTRSDERIREDANDRLTDDWRVDARQISVSVENGEVTLSGKVPNREAKHRAEDCIERISGVKHVQNNLRVDDTLTNTTGTSSSWGQSGSGTSGTTASSSLGSTGANSTTGAASKGMTTGSTSA